MLAALGSLRVEECVGGSGFTGLMDHLDFRGLGFWGIGV